jgi:hypothetical protein
MPPERVERLVAAARRAGGGSDWGAVRLLLCLLKYFGHLSPEMRTATAIALITTGIELDRDCEVVRWN